LDLTHESWPQIEAHQIQQVLHFLLNNPAFEVNTYLGKESPALDPPPPVDELPSGVENITLQYLLGTVVVTVVCLG